MAVIRDFNLFPVLVRRVDEFLTQTECVEIVSKLDTSAFGPHGALFGNATSSFEHGFRESRHALDEVEGLIKIKDKVLDQTETYARDFGMRPVRLANSWINIQRERSRLQFHAHPLSVVSGVLYLKVDEASSKTTFCNPNVFVEMTLSTQQPTSYTTTTVSVPPTAGSLVLFPSWLKHGSLDLNESAERVVLSFNTRPAVPDLV